MLVANYYIGILILSLFVAVFVLLCMVCRSKDRLFFNDVIEDINKMKEKHWDVYPVTNDNKKLLGKKIQRMLNGIMDQNTGIKAFATFKGDDLILHIDLKSMWAVKPFQVAEPK